METVPTGSNCGLTANEKRERIEAWYWSPDLKIGSAALKFFSKALFEVAEEINSDTIRDTFAQASPEQIDRLWKQYLLAQFVS